jgi:hypothetical protein
MEVVRSGDVFHLVCTGTADIGVSVVRARQLIYAVGAATAVPLGEGLSVRGGGERNSSPSESGNDTWVEVSLSGEVSRLRTGEKTSIGNYSISVLRCFEDGIPGTYECLAISLNGLVVHATAVTWAERLTKPNAGLVMTQWPARDPTPSQAGKRWWKVW